MPSRLFIVATLAALTIALPAAASAAVPGDLDTGFGTAGSTLSQLSPGSPPQTAFTAMAVDSQGRIVVAGSARTPSGTPIDQVLIARYLPSGALDTSFANNGVYLHEFGSGILGSFLNYLALQPDGSIVAGGYRDAGSIQDLLVLRLTPSGQLDTAGFDPSGSAGGTPGAVIEQFSGTISHPDTDIRGLALSGSNIVVAGQTYDSSSNKLGYLARITSAGALDGTFGSGGWQTYQFSSAGSPASFAATPLPQGDGSVVFATVAADNSGNGKTGIAKVDSGGSLVGGFGTSLLPDPASPKAFASIDAPNLVQQPGGRFVALGDGVNSISAGQALALIGFTSQGALDNSFATQGVELFQPDNTQNSAAPVNGLVVQHNGRLLAADDNGDGLATVERFTANGQPDGTYAQAGLYKHQFGAGSMATSLINALAIDGGGQLLMAGLATDASGNDLGLVARQFLDIPAAAFTFSPQSPVVGQPVTFTSQASDPGGVITGLAWDLSGLGTFTDASGASATTTFSTTGAHTVSLRVSDDDGLSATASQTVTVQPAPSTATGTGTGGGAGAPALRPGRVSFLSAVATVSGGVAGVKVACSRPSTGCTGALTLQVSTTKLVKTKHGKRRVKTTVVLGSAKFSLAPGQVKTLAVSLSKAARRKLAAARGGRLKAQGVVRQTNGGPSSTGPETLKLKPVKKKRKA